MTLIARFSRGEYLIKFQLPNVFFNIIYIFVLINDMRPFKFIL